MKPLIVERRVRWYQRSLHEFLVKGGKRAIEIAHRRWGKDEIALMATCELAHRRAASYWHCLPEYAQGRKALWDAVNAHTGVRRIDEAFPPELRESKDEQKMFIKLKCGSTWQVIGSDRYDATVGSGVAGIVYSEWALANPSAWAYHRPMLEENNGWALFITTPRGRNHAKAMYDMALKSPRWFAEVSSIAATQALTDGQLDGALQEYMALYGEDLGRAQFEQEYLCSFNAAVLGAFYAREMLAVRDQNRIAEIEHVDAHEVHTAWDIGVRDDTSIWWFQVIGGQVFIYDCYTASGAGIEHYAEICRQRAAEHGWRQGFDFVPHDAAAREWGTGRTRLESMQREGLQPRLVPLHSKLDGIQAARITLGKTIFHPRCEDKGIAALEQYRREWDDEKKTFRASEARDWTTHLADAFRYLAMSWRELPQTQTILKPSPQPGQVYLPGPPEPTRTTRIRI